jgi:integrase
MTNLSRFIDYCIVLFLSTSGLRAAEAITIRWKDLDVIELADNQVKWVISFIGKGGVEVNGHEIYEGAVVALVNLHLSVFGDMYDDNTLLIDRSGNPFNYFGLYMRVRRMAERAKQAGIIRKSLSLTPHTFRRTYCSLLFKSGMSIKALQIKSRHKDVSTLLKHYVVDEQDASPIFNKILKLKENM